MKDAEINEALLCSHILPHIFIRVEIITTISAQITPQAHLSCTFWQKEIQLFPLTCAPALNFFFSCCCLSLCHFPPMSFSNTLTGFHFTASQRLHLLYSSRNLSQQHAHARACNVNTDGGPVSSMSLTYIKHTMTSYDQLFNIRLGK